MKAKTKNTVSSLAHTALLQISLPLARILKIWKDFLVVIHYLDNIHDQIPSLFIKEFPINSLNNTLDGYHVTVLVELIGHIYCAVQSKYIRNCCDNNLYLQSAKKVDLFM